MHIAILWSANHIQMLFYGLCVSDHYLASINYLHAGAPKVGWCRLIPAMKVPGFST